MEATTMGYIGFRVYGVLAKVVHNQGDRDHDPVHKELRRNAWD